MSQCKATTNRHVLKMCYKHKITGGNPASKQVKKQITSSGTVKNIGGVFMKDIEIQEFHAQSCCLSLRKEMRKYLQAFRSSENIMLYTFFEHTCQMRKEFQNLGVGMS